MADSKNKSIATIIVNRNQPDLTDSLVEQISAMRGVEMDVFIIEMGSNNDKFSKYASYWYFDQQFSGKCLGHNIGLAYARGKGEYRYFFFLMNDLVFNDRDAVKKMLTVMEGEPQMGILSPTEVKSVNNFPCSAPVSDSIWHKVSTCDYLALLMRKECLDEVGFLNPSFRYSWGAIHELSYKMYQKRWFIAYADTVQMKHIGGTTYGKVEGAVSRDEYKRQARLWAAKYFRESYGPNWNEEFSKYLPNDIPFNTYTWSKKYWEEELTRTTSKDSKSVISLNNWLEYVTSLIRKIKGSS